VRKGGGAERRLRAAPLPLWYGCLVAFCGGGQKAGAPALFL